MTFEKTKKTNTTKALTKKTQTANSSPLNSLLQQPFQILRYSLSLTKIKRTLHNQIFVRVFESQIMV